jgi:hypothetical protein
MVREYYAGDIHVSYPKLIYSPIRCGGSSIVVEIL